MYKGYPILDKSVFVSIEEKGSKRKKRNDSQWKAFVRKKESIWSQKKNAVGGALLDPIIYYKWCEFPLCSRIECRTVKIVLDAKHW